MSIKKNYSICLTVLLFLAGSTIGANHYLPDLQELMKQSQDKLNLAYAADLENTKLKKVEIKFTKEGFFRYRRTFITGKQEYFSFNCSQFEQLDFLGNVQSGFLILKTQPESIIVQTFRDNKGNIDTMASQLKLPLKNMEAQDVQQLQDCFLAIRQKLNPANL